MDNGKDQRIIRINANLMPEAQILRFYELHIHIRFRAYYVLGMALFAVEIKINNFSGRNRSGNNQYQ